MREIRYDSPSPAEAVAFFNDMRDELATIRRAIVVLSRHGSRDKSSSLLIRDANGDAIILTGWQASTHVQRTRATVRILTAAGFAPERTEVVYTHRIVRITRTPDGSTSLEEATGLTTRPRANTDLAQPGLAQLEAARAMEPTR